MRPQVKHEQFSVEEAVKAGMPEELAEMYGYFSEFGCAFVVLLPKHAPCSRLLVSLYLRESQKCHLNVTAGTFWNVDSELDFRVHQCLLRQGLLDIDSCPSPSLRSQLRGVIFGCSAAWEKENCSRTAKANCERAVLLPQGAV